MPQRLRRARAVGVPDRCAPVQPADEVRHLEAQLRAQQLREQRVVAEPSAVGTQRRHERVLALEPSQRLLPVAPPGDRIRELPREHVGDGGLQQEVAQLRRLLCQHLCQQEARDGRVVAGEVIDERLRLIVGAQRQRREPQSGRPALRPAPESRRGLR